MNGGLAKAMGERQLTPRSLVWLETKEGETERERAGERDEKKEEGLVEIMSSVLFLFFLLFLLLPFLNRHRERREEEEKSRDDAETRKTCKFCPRAIFLALVDFFC